MFVQATIHCGCGCVSRTELQDGKQQYVCPNCKKVMDTTAYKKLTSIMGELSDWNLDAAKNASGLNEPEMRVVSLSVADLIG